MKALLIAIIVLPMVAYHGAKVVQSSIATNPTPQVVDMPEKAAGVEYGYVYQCHTDIQCEKEEELVEQYLDMGILPNDRAHRLTIKNFISNF